MCEAEKISGSVVKGDYVPSDGSPSPMTGCAGSVGYLYSCSIYHPDFPITDCVE